MMKVTGKEVFPLALLLVKNQMRANLIEIAHLLILDQPDKPAAGFYKHENRTICLNVGVLENYFVKYEIEPNHPLAKLRCAAAIIFEECWHAIHASDTGEIAEAKARQYAVDLLKRLPDELLVAHGGKLYKDTQQTTAIALPEPEKVEVEDSKPRTMPIVSGGMFDFVNKITELCLPNTEIETKYGSMRLETTGDTSVLSFVINQDKLNALKDFIGNVTEAGIKHSGLIYTWENDGWTVLADIDDKKMLEINQSKPFTITALKSGKDLVIEASI